jgi:hypothetical protein
MTVEKFQQGLLFVGFKVPEGMIQVKEKMFISHNAAKVQNTRQMGFPD